MLFPFGISTFLGLPYTEQYFYPVIFGAVLFGIGIALSIEGWKGEKQLTGLGLAGAIAINLCGAITLALWLIFVDLNIPLHGMLILSLIAFVVILIGLIELFIIIKSGNK